MGILDYFNTAGGYDPNQKTKEQESLLGKLPNVFMTPNFAETGDITESQQKSLESQSKKAGYGLALVDFLTRQRNLGAKSALPYIGEAFKTGFGGAQDMYRTGLAQNLKTRQLDLQERFGLGTPYYSPVPTESGYMVFNNRTGKYEPMTDKSGQPILPAAYSPELQGKITGAKVSVIGAGGSARAVVYTLLRHFKPCELNIINRSQQRADSLVNDLSLKMRYDSFHTFELFPPDNVETFSSSTLIVNATTIGMYPDVEDSITDLDESFNEDQIVFDLVYNPTKTNFLKLAEAQGAKVVGGLQMLISQAAKSFELWTGVEMPTKEISEKLKQNIQNESA